MTRWNAPSRAVTLLLVAATALAPAPAYSASAHPAAAPAPADPAPPAPGEPGAPAESDAPAEPGDPGDPAAPGDPAEPGAAPGEPLVPGVEGARVPEYPMDTPDQVLPPVPQDGSGGVVPVPEPEGEVDELVEYLPRSALAAACTAQAGPHQRRVERLLKLKVDGRQSTADCKAIRAFQVKEKIKPAKGYAGPVTWARAELLAARKNPNAAGKCPVTSSTVACVDLDRELMWVQKGKKVTFAVVNIRSGRPGYRTRTGWKKVYLRNKDHWSTLYNTPMPYSQFFDGGQAFHAVYGQLATPTGSRGCVNLSHADAKRLWGVLRKGDRVYI
ncbi:L,D-transpeptidase family protein [Streptomyces sp. NPDC090127]|uniref:L,D-transpeptidase family protein n=1 Tax=Streptomyces sp. NPDC090127 TaxID=3365953 RepID=UPI0037FDD7F5